MECASEFFDCVLSLMKNEMEVLTAQNCVEPSIFEGILCRTTSCGNCGKGSKIVRELITSINVQVENDLTTCLTKFYTPTLSESSTCGYCKFVGSEITDVTIEMLPKIFVVTIQRNTWSDEFKTMQVFFLNFYQTK